MPSKTSAGLLMFRVRNGTVEVLLVHPGGPFFQNKDDGAWTIPKGEITEGEDLLARARLEFEEELGIAPSGHWLELGSVKQKGGKMVHAWAFAGDLEEDSSLPRIHSRWSGRRVPAKRSAFLKWIGPVFFRWRKRERKSTWRRLRSSTA